MHTLILFPKNLNQRSLTPTWPLTPCLLRSHTMWLVAPTRASTCVQVPWQATSMYVDTVINVANYHIHTYTYIHTTYRTSDHIVSYWTQFRRDKNERLKERHPTFTKKWQREMIDEGATICGSTNPCTNWVSFKATEGMCRHINVVDTHIMVTLRFLCLNVRKVSLVVICAVI